MDDNMDDNIEEEKKEIEIVTDDDTELDISNVYDHLNLDKVRDNPDRQNIIIPGIIQEDKKEDLNDNEGLNENDNDNEEQDDNDNDNDNN